MDWKTCNYSKEYLNEMIDITKQNYGDIEISDIEFLQWQYFSNPSGEAFIKLAKSIKDEVVGQYIVIPMKIKVNDNIVKSTLSLNTLTRKDYRGKGIFTGLANALYQDCKEQNVEFTYGFPNQNSYPGFMKKLEFSDLGEIPLMLYPLNIKQLVLKKFNSAFLALLSSPFKSIFNIKIRNKHNLKIKEIDDFEEFNVFWEKIKSKYKVIGLRDSQYMKWRYSNVPRRKYKIIGVYRNNELIAYAVTRDSEIEHFRCGMIVDYMVNEGEKEAGKFLLSEVLNIFKRDGMELVGCLMGKATEEYSILKKCKFLKCPKFLEPQPFKVIYRNHLYKHDKTLENLDNWFLTMGDYDVI
ncbi:conserved hypothetical protein [Clostridium neonatale]|uniref:GNAT family N-acetyltransferase n=1 Tax=Clostridium neonatale TaxID=137838 RepID=UPI00291B9F8B|nr:GNAT family N-acetyltransferase [Clostridium neonatale]CAI3633303.1 conserved hypothetical protein [Clostridium neonatale]